MLDKRAIFAIHHYRNLGYAKARIASLLNLDKKTVAKYLANPEPERKKVQRESLLDPFRAEIGELLSRDPQAIGRRHPATAPDQGVRRQDHHRPRLSGHGPAEIPPSFHPFRERARRAMPSRLGSFRRHRLWQYRQEALLPGGYRKP